MLRSSDGLTGARRPAFKVVDSPGSWQEASVPRGMGLSKLGLSVLGMCVIQERSKDTPRAFML